MFSIGDKIVYPMYGAGVISSIEEKEVLNERKKYYIMNMIVSNIDIMIPVDRICKLGIRYIIEKSQVDEVISILKNAQSQIEEKWNKRYRDNLDKIKTGDIYEICLVIKMLSMQERKKPLSTGEKKMLTEAKDMISSELALVLDKDFTQMKELIEKWVNND
ncbi:transcriptional regulator, CarD family [Alkalithermobacter thermoalcaliphilus JW-YL-7 = DSM 7308]|uniref:Transcriptional regulator, CarD family n=1 Tax=Alkalithermobacter thermoalcaliphilus JW-YL-7 = DSM 7308 TaxID=1121328 RepID=A0A150FP48_CLOPD|nr:transcriptional regulator, CarD family [[Clostridium] paradoxum JW-YL-7 = DSM 7308]SHL26960.1 transcriptional regulator, CarD family [[Clostridium] paradoxum JW-YL-7 = DSM 7308]